MKTCKIGLKFKNIAQPRFVPVDCYWFCSDEKVEKYDNADLCR